jgi:hypothetical protein
MCAQPTIHDSDTENDTDYTNSGDPVEVDYLLSSNMLHGSDDGDDDNDQHISRPTTTSVDVDDFAAEHIEDELPEAVVAAPAKRGRRSGPALPPPPTVDATGAPLSVYQRLVDYGLLRKITDIVMAKVAIPWHLRADATQEVHVAWATLKAKPEFQRNQLANYAYMSGQHAALKLRRTIGAVVAIPGALFRTGRDSAFMESIGAAVNPKDVEDYKDSLELSCEPAEDLQLSRISDTFFDERLGDLNLSAKQTLVARKALIERKAADDIAVELGMDLMYVERLLNQVTLKLVNKDDGGVTPVKAVRKSRKVVVPDDVVLPAKASEKSPRRTLTALKKKVAA